jgi:hypothetical protein
MLQPLQFDGTANVDNGLDLGDQLLDGFELADDVLGCLPGALNARVSGPGWADEGFYSPWNNLQGPAQLLLIEDCAPAWSHDYI